MYPRFLFRKPEPMRTNIYPQTPFFRIASDIPGRIRLQLTGASRNRRMLTALSARLSALPEVRDARVVQDAGSLIVRYAGADRASGEVAKDISAVAAEFLKGALSSGSGKATVAQREEHEASSSSAFSAVPEYARHTGLPVRGKAALQTSSRTTTTGTGSGLRPLLFSLLGVGAAALEAAPVLLVGAALALGALPLARRAMGAVRRRRMSSDYFDLINLVVLASIGDLLSAGQISLILNLSDYWRSRKLRHVRRKLSEVMLLEYLGRDTEAPQLVRMIEDASVSNALVENQIARTGDRLIGPLLGVAAGAYVMTGDLLRVTAILKFSDLSSDVRISAPATVLTMMTAGAHNGFLVHSARAMEKLACADTLVFDTAGSERAMEKEPERKAEFSEAVEMLLERGLRRIVLRRHPAPPHGRRTRAVSVPPSGISCSYPRRSCP